MSIERDLGPPSPEARAALCDLAADLAAAPEAPWTWAALSLAGEALAADTIEQVARALRLLVTLRERTAPPPPDPPRPAAQARSRLYLIRGGRRD